MATLPRPALRLALGTLALALAACTTPYGARGFSGGYAEQRLAEARYLVTYEGTGSTPPQRIFYFSLYRCAELTVEKGYAFFELEAERAVVGRREDPDGATRLSVSPPTGGGGLARPATAIPVFIPSALLMSRSVISMFNEVPDGRALLDARRVMELLGPYVRSHGTTAPPPLKLVYRGAAVKAGPTGKAERVFPEGQSVGFLDLRRVLDGVAEGQAARQRIKARRDDLQKEVDARQAEVQRLRAAYDAEQAPAVKRNLEAELTAKKGALRLHVERSQASIDDDEKQAVRDIAARVDPVVEQVRAARKLDTITTQGAAAFWDADVTDEVIKAYREQHPAPSET